MLEEFELILEEINRSIKDIYPKCKSFDPKLVLRLNIIIGYVRNEIVESTNNIDDLMERVNKINSVRCLERDSLAKRLDASLKKTKMSEYQRQLFIMEQCFKYEKSKGIYYAEEYKRLAHRIILSTSKPDYIEEKNKYFLILKTISFLVLLMFLENLSDLKELDEKHIDEIEDMKFI